MEETFTMNNITYSAKSSDIQRKWYIIDASGKPLGRVAAEAAKLLRGKHKPTFTPNVDTGDHVIILNCKDVVLTGRKLDQKIYRHHTGYIGNTLEHFAVKSSLLICESTFLKGQDKGKNDYHLYAYEAAQIARVAKPNHLLLTHFWPEIDKKLYLAEAKNIYKSTDVAEEGMVLKLTP